MPLKTRTALDADLDALQARIPALIAENEPDSVLEAFAGEAEAIEEATGPEDREHVSGRIQCMLSSAGLIPGENEGEPCG